MRKSAHRWSRVDYKNTSKMNDAFHNVLKRTSEPYDHVAIDIGAYTAQAGRMLKDLVGQERDAECLRFVHKTVFSTLLKRIQPKKSIAIFFDGSEPLWKLRRTRVFPGKRFDSRFYRSAASPMVYALEDKLRTTIGDSVKVAPTLAVDTTKSKTLSEFLVSGPATPGPAESKMSQWMLDMASRSDVSINDSFCLLGGTDLFMTALGATPFHNVTTVTFGGHTGDCKSFSVQETMDWLCMEHVFAAAAAGGGQRRLAMVRTDATLLLLMCNGITATDFSGIGVSFRDVMDAYCDLCASDKSEDGFSLTAHDLLSPMIKLKCSALEKVLVKATRKSAGVARPCNLSSDQLEVLLQSHNMVCNGGIANHRFTPRKSEPTVLEKPPVLRLESFVGHLRHLASQGDGTVSPTVDESFALTGTEQLLLSSPNTQLIDQIFPLFSGGHPLPGNVAEDIVQTRDIDDALDKVRNVLSVMDCESPSSSPHRASAYYPSHYYFRAQGAAGPPPGFDYRSVNLGIKSRALGTRRTSMSVAKSEAMVVDAGAASSKNMMSVFDAAAGQWVEAPCKDISDPAASGASGPKPYPSVLKVLTWNTQFNRHSGEQTPLGRQGIDWCSSTRYHALAYVLSQTDADVIAMQEVETPWLEFLADQEWVRRDYVLSCLPSSKVLQPWGVAMLVHRRLNIAASTIDNVAAFSGHTSLMPSISIQLSASTSVVINSFHLLAPYNDNHVSNRVTQLQNLNKKLDANVVGLNCIAMGDFNDHPAQFFAFPSELSMKDAWLQLNPPVRSGSELDESGFTINGKTNKYCSLIIEPQFFGRPDRIVYRSNRLQPVDVSLIGTTSVMELKNSGLLPALPTDAKLPDYLFPSDHFGVMAEFQVV